MGRFSDVKQILDDAVGNRDIGQHGRFWLNKTRNDFVNLDVFGEQLLIEGDGANSNLVQALRGEGLFGADLAVPPPNAVYRRMPAGRPPVPDDKIDFIKAWIDDGCPDDVPPPAVAK